VSEAADVRNPPLTDLPRGGFQVKASSVRSQARRQVPLSTHNGRSVRPLPGVAKTAYRGEMKYSSLLAFLNGELHPSQFRDEIASEVEECTSALRTTGNGSISITEGPDTVLIRAHALRLLEAVADKTLSSEMASYIADCIIMGDIFGTEDDQILDAIHFLADGDYWPLSDRDIRSHIDVLR
jgi:hypothetical protein